MLCRAARVVGTAHFLEHLAFKGTSKRTQAQLELEVENMGAMFNAYTSRELTTYYAKCFSSDVGATTEIISDLVKNATLDAGAVEAERKTILREMQEVNLMEEELVLDYLHATAYQGTPLGYTILGPEANIKTITRDDLKTYIDTHYTAPRMVLAAAGGIEHEELVAYAEQHFGSLSSEDNTPEATLCSFTGSEIRDRNDELPFAHIALAVEGVGHAHKDYMPLMVASTIIGNWNRSFGGGMNLSSHLARMCTEHGWANSYSSFLTSYSDTGLWGIYAVCHPQKTEEFVYELQEEWARMCVSVNDTEVARAKNQLKAAMVFANDGTTATCDEIGRQVLQRGSRVSPVELDASIEAVTPATIKQVMDEYVWDQPPAVVGVGPTENLTDYARILSGMSKLRR